ncbi:MAG TPA: zinc ribbon domain-containing protein [Longimicrobium sp.]|nr:zinc ribbon domain-containing protein [Longimicrobium sp.]
MPLTACRECGAAIPAHSHACPNCGARIAPAAVAPAAYRPVPPRPPQEPERSGGWQTAVGWAAVVGLCAFLGLFFFRLYAEADRRALEKAEVAREWEHIHQMNAWMLDTLSTAPEPETAGWAVPTSARARRMWVISRMLVDRMVWEREVGERYGVKGLSAPAAWATPPYWANARSHPDVGKYVEGRVATLAEIEKTADAWMEERTAALARESGMPAAEIRAIFSRDFARAALDDARLADAMLELHRLAVRMDPRVHHGGGNQLLWDREDDMHRFDALLDTLNAAAAHSRQAHARRESRELPALSPQLD